MARAAIGFEKGSLTGRQRDILEFLKRWNERHAYPPTVREVQQGLSISSTSVVDYNFKILERRGLIERTGGLSRSIRVLGGANNCVCVPVVGGLARLEPVGRLVLSNYEGGVLAVSDDGRNGAAKEEVCVSRRMLGVRDASEVYALRLTDNTFADDLLCKDDLVLVSASDELSVGKVCLVEIRRRSGEFVETMVGRVRMDDGLILLESLGPSAAIVRCDLARYAVLIRGVAVGMVRAGF